MALEGELIVRLDCREQRVRHVTVHSTRPMVAARLLGGKSAVDAVAMVPKLYSVCAGAQGAAAAAALAAAGATGYGAPISRSATTKCCWNRCRTHTGTC